MSMMAGNMNSQLIFIFENERPLFAPDSAVFSLEKKNFFFGININLGNKNQRFCIGYFTYTK